jgi:CBS domain-containing protein
MCAPVLTIEARAPLHEIAEMLKVHDIKHLPVMQGDRMVGIVNRPDLVRAMATQIPKPTIGRSGGGLLSLFTGMMQTDLRPENAPASALAAVAERAPVTAGSFRELVTVAKQVGRDDAVAVKNLAALERERQIEACCWTTSSYGSSGSTAPQRRRHRAKAALTHPIPCDPCSDGGRKIDVAEIDWSSTLRGEAAEVYARWERELRPDGFRLRAQIVEYLDGIPNNIALSPSRSLLNPTKWSTNTEPCRQNEQNRRCTDSGSRSDDL